MDKRKSITHQQMNNQNWRYKKKTPPVEEHADMNGPVKVVVPKKDKPSVVFQSTPIATSLPHPFKCSKCDYIATSTADSKEHWLDHD